MGKRGRQLIREQAYKLSARFGIPCLRLASTRFPLTVRLGLKESLKIQKWFFQQFPRNDRKHVRNRHGRPECRNGVSLLPKKPLEGIIGNLVQQVESVADR